MELLHSWFFDVLATAFCASSVIVTAGVAVALLVSRNQRVGLAPLVVSLVALTLLGFVTGETMAQSREPAVGAVIPAVLTLLGGLAVYVIGTRGLEERISSSAAIACFALATLVGSLFGVQLRYEFEDDQTDPLRARTEQLAAAQNQLILESKKLEYYTDFLKAKQQLEQENKLDLSRFDSSYEHPAGIGAQVPSKLSTQKEIK